MKSSFYTRKIEHLKQTEPGTFHQQIIHLTGLQKQSFSLPESNKSFFESANEINSHFAKICSDLPPLNLSVLTPYLPASSLPP